jgi:DNA mismatch repair protein MutS2
MESKTLQVLEYDKVLTRLAGFCDFSASVDLAKALHPTSDFNEAVRLLAETTEARLLLSTHDMTVGGSHDIRPSLELAVRGGVLDPHALLDVKSTLIACREIRKSLLGKTLPEPGPDWKHVAEEPRPAETRFPRLAHIAAGLPDTFGIVDAITRVLSDRGDVLDSASPRLADIRHDLKVVHDRLMSRLQRYLTESANKLQEPIITQRDGRYVIPLRAEFKGQIKAIVHDQSSTGATLFVEPLPIVELNNEVRELELAERDEERRILAELSALIGAHRDELTYGVESLALLDLAFAKAKYAQETHSTEPVLHKLTNLKHKSTPSEDARHPAVEAPSLKLLQARHPLLDPAKVVPVDINPKPGTRALVITGPNTGGKTVSLKTVGLLVLMAQSGLHIPVQSGSELACFAAVYADIGDEQSIEQSLSTFSGHITNIIRILKVADQRSLVMLDELGAGTDPQEGAALARVILRHLIELGATTFVATHYPELKTFAHTTDGVVNASLEFDIRTLRPTYRLTIGLPGRSNALLIAQRLGLDPQLVEAARGDINPDELRADKLLDDIRKERNRTSREREKLEKARGKLDSQTQELGKRLEKLEDERRDVLARTRAEGELEVAVLRENLAALRSQLKKARQPLQALKDIEQQADAIQEKIEAPVERKPQPSDLPPSAIKLGERVFLRSLNSEGIVAALGESDVEVQVGTLRIRAKFSDVEKAAIPAADVGEKDRPRSEVARRTHAALPEPQKSARRSPIPASPGMEISLRGKLVEDGLDELERYLEKAYASGLPFVRIVHGKGTGRLREAVRVALKTSPLVSSFEEAPDNEGGAGVTIAHMAGK